MPRALNLKVIQMFWSFKKAETGKLYLRKVHSILFKNIIWAGCNLDVNPVSPNPKIAKDQPLMLAFACLLLLRRSHWQTASGYINRISRLEQKLRAATSHSLVNAQVLVLVDVFIVEAVFVELEKLASALHRHIRLEKVSSSSTRSRWHNTSHSIWKSPNCQELNWFKSPQRSPKLGEDMKS